MTERMSVQEFRKKYSKKRPRWGWKNKSECWGGCRISGISRMHDSAEEAWYCNQLSLLQKEGEIEYYESQKRFDLKDPDGNSCGWHVVDFLIQKNGKKEVHEYKGDHLNKTTEYRQKKALFKFNYPEIPYTTVTKRDIVL